MNHLVLQFDDVGIFGAVRNRDFEGGPQGYRAGR
jgi:hypothetical protein